MDTAACTCGAPKGRAHTKDCALHEHTRVEFARALSAASPRCFYCLWTMRWSDWSSRFYCQNRECCAHGQ